MSHDLYTYAQTDPIYFKLVDSSGDGVAASLVAGDVKISKDGATAVNVNTLPTAISGMTGVFEWTPISSETSCEVFVLNIVDQDGPAWVENCIIVSTGGNALARFSG